MASSLNADNGVVSGSAGLKSSADSSGVLELQASGAAVLTLNSTNSVFNKSLLETVTITAAAPASTQTYDAITQQVQLYTTNAANTWVVNLRGSSSVSMNTLLATGQSMTCAMLVTQGSSGASYYVTSVQVDGTTSGVTTKWQNGAAPSAGSASAIDAYSFTVIKTGSAAYTVLAALTKFA